MDYRLEVVLLPVGNVDRSIEFYTKGCGFNLDVDYHPNDGFRVVQLTPRGSACSVQFGIGLSEEAPGSPTNIYLAVPDIELARKELVDRGVDVKTVRRKCSVTDWQGDTTEGIDPERRNYSSFASFTDPDGNTWALQEIGHTSESPTGA